MNIEIKMNINTELRLSSDGAALDNLRKGFARVLPSLPVRAHAPVLSENRAALVSAGAALAAAGALIFLLAPGKSNKKQRAPFKKRNFAHRGLHSIDKSVPENSLKAFSLAVGSGYGMELDVQLSKDGQLVVFHDDTLDRVCGVRGRVDEYTYAELSSFSLCGTAERIPLFSELLSLVDGKTPLIVELKTGKRNRELCEKTYALLKEYNGDACIESFNPLIVAWFRCHAPKLLRGQLATTADDYKDQSKLSAFLLSRTLLNFLARPQFIAYNIKGRRPLTARLSCLLGAMNIGWTSHDAGSERGRDAVIFEFYRPETKY